MAEMPGESDEIDHFGVGGSVDTDRESTSGGPVARRANDNPACLSTAYAKHLPLDSPGERRRQPIRSNPEA
jgi:hypothetical protein